jgi:tripartite ATP-independent transporter DctP family solute receptor
LNNFWFNKGIIVLKKNLTIISFLLLFLCLFSSCSKDSGDKSNKVYKIKIAHGLTKNTHCHKGLEYFKELLETHSQGRIKATLYSGGELGDSRSLVEGMQMGTVQIVVTAVAPLSAFESKLMLCDLPFIFESHQHAETVLDGPVGKKISEDLPRKAKIRLLSYWVSGFRNVFNDIKPIRKIEDLEGMKIRVMETPVHISSFKELGAIPTPMSFGELYMALAQGVVDAAENDADAFWSQRFYEVCKYYSLTKHSYTALALIISEKFYQKLPSDLRQILEQSAKEARDYERKIARQMNQDAIEKLKQHGIKINDLDRKPFRDAVSDVYDKYENQIGKEILQQVLKNKPAD